MTPTVWILAGDDAVANPLLVEALTRMNLRLTFIPSGQGFRFWSAEAPDMVVYGRAATSPLHPLLMKLGLAGTHRVFVTCRRSAAPLEEEVDTHISVPGSLSRIRLALERALGPRQAPAQIAM